MQLSWDIIDANAVAFSKRWKDAWDEKSEAQSFVAENSKINSKDLTEVEIVAKLMMRYQKLAGQP